MFQTERGMPSLVGTIAWSPGLPAPFGVLANLRATAPVALRNDVAVTMWISIDAASICPSWYKEIVGRMIEMVDGKLFGDIDLFESECEILKWGLVGNPKRTNNETLQEFNNLVGHPTSPCTPYGV